jgi:hypothetical protein
MRCVGSVALPMKSLLDGIPCRIQGDRFLSPLQGLRISRYPGEDAFLGSHKVGDCTQHRFSSCKGFLLPPHPQVGTPVSRKRFARSSATSVIRSAIKNHEKICLAQGVDYGKENTLDKLILHQDGGRATFQVIYHLASKWCQSHDSNFSSLIWRGLNSSHERRKESLRVLGLPLPVPQQRSSRATGGY